MTDNLTTEQQEAAEKMSIAYKIPIEEATDVVLTFGTNFKLATWQRFDIEKLIKKNPGVKIK